jgi:sphingomyelin phosphodiesterase
MFAAIESLNPAFTIFTGDVAAHDVWLVDQTEVETDLNATYSDMRALKQVYPALGNHDTAPVNAFPPAAVGSSSAQWAYDTMSADWMTWLDTSADKSVDQYGSYSELYPGTKLRVISFNSIFYYILNFWMYEEPMEADPSGQLAWLVSELQAAETAGERVWLISHIPSGSGDFFHQYSASFDEIVQRYEATISALFYGHTHVDEFQIAYSDYTNPSAENAVAVSYIAPSMTPTSGSPSFRVYSVDPETFAILDFTQYIANISDPSFQTNPTWQKYYSAKETYGPLVSPPVTDPAAELAPAFWHSVTALFESDDAQFQDYYARKSRGFSPATCTSSCKTSEICQLRAAQSQYNCQVTTPGVHFSKRDANADGETYHQDECEGTAIRGIFWTLAENKDTFAAQINARVKAMS